MSGDRPLWEAYIEGRLDHLRHSTSEPGYPSLETIERAWQWAQANLGVDTRTPSVLPDGEASVEFVWHRNGWHLEIGIAATCADDYLFAKDTTTPLGEAIFGHLDLLRDEASRLIGEVSK